MYVGQTITNFSTRWNQHRSIWKSGSSEHSDKAALRVHFQKEHADEKDRALDQAYGVVFVDRPGSPSGLDYAESRWINKLEATININSTVLPKVL